MRIIDKSKKWTELCFLQSLNSKWEKPSLNTGIKVTKKLVLFHKFDWNVNSVHTLNYFKFETLLAFNYLLTVLNLTCFICTFSWYFYSCEQGFVIKLKRVKILDFLFLIVFCMPRFAEWLFSDFFFFFFFFAILFEVTCGKRILTAEHTKSFPEETELERVWKKRKKTEIGRV